MLRKYEREKRLYMKRKKLSLWCFRVIKGCCFAICSVRLSMLSSWAMDFACESMMLVASLLAFL